MGYFLIKIIMREIHSQNYKLYLKFNIQRTNQGTKERIHRNQVKIHTQKDKMQYREETMTLLEARLHRIKNAELDAPN